MPNPVPTPVFSPASLDSLVARMIRWAREPLDKDVCRDAINDAIESLWMAASLASLSKFTKGPVTQVIPANSQSFAVVTIPDPVQTYLVARSVAGGALPLRAYSLSFTYATDSGSETKVSPATTIQIGAGALASAQPPVIVPDALGWNLYADTGNGRQVRQNDQPLAFTTTWIEPPQGALADGSHAPAYNTTGDNICSIERLDVANQDGTFTSWLSTDIASSFFSMYQNRYPLASSFPRHAYDLLGDRMVEFRPMAGTDLDATLFFITRPRRLAYGSSRLPSFTFPSDAFLANRALADVVGSLEEAGAADRYSARADKELQAILLSIANEQWNRNTTVKPYMRY